MPASLRRRSAAVAALLLLSPACRSNPPQVAGEDPATVAPVPPLRLGVIGDQTFSDDLDAAYEVLRHGVDELARYHHHVAPLDAVLHTGDLLESAASPAEVTSRFATAVAILDRLPVPWYPAAGDHDVNPPEYRPGSTDRSRRVLFRRLLGGRVPAAADALHYVVDLGPHRLIVLDSQQVAHADPRWGNTFLARIDDRQLAWLAAELARPPRPASIVVALHQPQWLAWSGWQRVHELLRRHAVALVVAGHLHHPQDDGVLDGVRYLTVGAAGAVTRTGGRATGDVDHVTVVEIRGDGLREEVAVSPLALDGEPVHLPSRRDMERVQAVDVMLGALHGIADRHPVHLAGGRLVADCETGTAARVALAGIGNPIDLEVTLSITAPAEIELVAAAFAEGFCRPPSDPRREPTTCRLLVPGNNVRFSNPSGVEMATAPPLWQAVLELAPRPDGRPTAELLEDGLILDLRLSWQGERHGGAAPESPEPFWLERAIRLDVAPCP